MRNKMKQGLAVAATIGWTLVSAAVPSHTPEGFRVPQPGAPLSFPEDHGSHPEYRIEWWYLTGHLEDTEGSQFDIVVAGHTDDMRSGQPATREKHPDNWNLSAHRALSVLSKMTANNIDPERVSARAFGEFRPIAENAPNKKGNPQNRRVEIYIVAKGA